MSIEMCNLSSNIFNSGKPWEGFWGQMRCAHSCGILGWTTGSHCWRWNPPGQSTAQSLCPGAPWSEMWHLDVPSLRCTNHRKLLCSDETTFWILKQAHFFLNLPSPPIRACWKEDSCMLNSTAYVVILWSVSEANTWEFTLKMYILCSRTGRANPSIFAMP